MKQGSKRDGAFCFTCRRLGVMKQKGRSLLLHVSEVGGDCAGRK